MTAWDPAVYLAFGEQRTRPARDLARSVDIAAPRRVIDLGCGPGNSTAVCAERWPEASIVGLDGSEAMIAKARAADPGREWIVGDIGEWARSSGEQFDVIFANAALQWVPDHAALFPQLVAKLAPGGALAVQMPAYEMPPNRAMREIVRGETWRRWFPTGEAREWRSHEPAFYYEALAGRAARLDLWTTEYVQVMADVDALVEWYRGTGLRPYLEAIGEASERERFLAEFREGLGREYRESQAGGMLFPFRRMFLVAYAVT